MREENLFNIGLAFGLFLLGLMFLKGYFHEERNTRFRRITDLDKIVFPGISNKAVVWAADKMAFWICVLMALLTMANGILAYKFDNIPNISALFIAIGVFGSWISRFIYIYIFKDKK